MFTWSSIHLILLLQSQNKVKQKIVNSNRTNFIKGHNSIFILSNES